MKNVSSKLVCKLWVSFYSPKTFSKSQDNTLKLTWNSEYSILEEEGNTELKI